MDWRNKVQFVGTGEVRYFRDWLICEAFVQQLLQGTTDSKASLESKDSEKRGIGDG